MMQSTEWYVAVNGRTVGPVTTDLLLTGIERGRVPGYAQICPVGGNQWLELAHVPPFSVKVSESSPPPLLEEQLPHAESPPPAYALHTTAENRASATLFQPEQHGPSPAGPDVPPPRAPMASEELQIEVSLDEFDGLESPAKTGGFAWDVPITSFGHLNGGIELPDQTLLLNSLASTHDTVLIQKDAMWNLALCLAFGSDELAQAAGRTFFRVYGQHVATDRLQWMPRVLLGRGFLPSGIPAEAGRRALSILQACCPGPLLGEFAKALRGPVA